MGQLQGKATYLKATTPFLNASERDVNKLWEGFNDVAEGFGLNQDEMVEICRSMQSTLEIHARNEMDQLSAGLFTALDTDENGLVDALEFLGTMAMMSAMPIPQKLTFVYNCYDFNETGQLSLDELTLALKSTLTGLCKLCVAVSCPTELVLEDLAQHAFQRSQKSGVNDFLTLPEFLRFSETTPEMTSWVDYFDCPDEIVDEQDGDDSDAEREAAASFLAPSAQDDESTARKRDVGLPQDSAAPDLSNNKVLPRRPWQLAVGNTAPSAPPKVDPRMPSASLELEWIYGYNSDVRGVVHYISPAEVIYPAGCVVIVYDIVAHRQRFACHHAGLVQALAVHPSDRSLIATSEAALKPKVVIWTTKGLSESGTGGGGGVLSVLRGFHRNGVSHLAWMPNGRTLVTVGQDEFHCVAVYQWERVTGSADGNAIIDVADWSKPGELIFAGRGGREPVHGLAVLNGPLGQPQFVTGGRRHLFFWTRERDTRYSSSHAIFSRLPGVLGRKAKVQTIMTVASLPADSQGSGALAGTARGQILLFEGRNCVRVLYAHAAAVTALFPFAGGLLSGGKDGKVRVWSRRLEPGAQFDLVALGSFAPRVRSLVASPDGGAKLLIATAGAEIYEIASSDGANLHFGSVVCGHASFQLHDLSTHPVRRECCSVGDDRTVRVWDLSAHRQLRIAVLDAPARACAYSPDGSNVAVGQGADDDDDETTMETDPDLLAWRRRQQPKLINPNKQGAFAVLNEASLSVKFEAKDSKRSIRTLRFSGDGLTLAVGSNDNCIYSYHTEDWASKGKCRARDAGVVLNTFDFSTTGEYIMANSRNRGELVFFESSSGVEVTRVATLKDVEWLSCSCPFGWSVQGAWPTLKANAYELSVVDRSTGPETPMLVSGDTLGSLRLFRYPCVSPESLCQVARGAASTISAVRFTADGTHVVAAARDERCIFQWRIEREEIDVDGEVSGSEDNADVAAASDDEREVSHGSDRSAFEEAVAVGDFALEILAERLHDPLEAEIDATAEDPPQATTTTSVIQGLPPSKPWVSSSVPPAEAPDESDLELSTVPNDSLELEWVYGYRCHDVRNNLFMTRAKGLLIYPAANIVVILDSKLWLQRHFRQHTDEVTSLTTQFGTSGKPNTALEIAASGQMGRQPVIHVWRIDSLEILASLRGFHRRGIAELRFNTSGNLLASVGLDDRNSLALYDWRNGELLAHASTTSVGRILGLSFQQEPNVKSSPAATTVLEDQVNPGDIPTPAVVVVTVGVKSASFWRLAAGKTFVKKDALVGRKGRQGGTPPSFLSVVCCGKDAIAGTVSGDLYRFKGVELTSIVPAHSRGVAALYSSTTASGGIASGGQDGLVKLWSADLECLAEFGEFNASARHAIRSVYWDVSRDTLLVGTRGSTIHLLSSLDGTPQTLKTPDSTPVTSLESHARGELHGLSVCYNKARGCTTGDDGVLRIWDLAHHLLVVSTKLETSSRACAYSPDGDFIAVGLGSGGTGRRHKKDGSMLVFEDRGQSVELVYETRDTKQSVTVLRFSPDGQTLVCGALDGSVYIYDVPSNYTKRAVFSKHKAPITHLDVASDSQYMRSNCRGFELLFADVTTGSHVASATALRNQIWDTCSTIYNWSNQGVWPVAPPGLGDAATREITCCACSTPGSSYRGSNAILAAGNSHGAINIFKFPSFVQGSGAKTYYGHSGAVAQLGFSGTAGALCLSIGRLDRCMLQWRRVHGITSEADGAANGNASVTKDPEDDPDLVVEGRFLPESFVNDGGGAQNEVRPYVSAILPPSGKTPEPGEVDGIAGQRTFELEHVFGFRAHDVRQNAVYARPKRVVFPTGCLGVSYDRREHYQQFYTGHTRPIFCLAASPGGAFVASGEICAQTFAHERPRIHVWEPATCTRVAELSAFHRKAVTSLAFSMPDGKLLAAVGQDEFHSLAVYRSVSGQWFDGALVANSRSTRHPVFFVCFIEEPQASGGCRLVSGGENHVLFWKLTPPALTARGGVFGARAQQQPVLCGASMGSLVITGCASGHLYLWEACAVGRVIPAHSGSVYAIHATALGCATGGRDGHVKLWARTTMAPLADFDVAGCQPAPHNAAVRALSWDVAEDRLLLGTKGAELLELSRLTGDTILVTESHFDHAAQLQGLCAHPLRPELVATAGGDHTVRVWHVAKRCVIAKTTLDGALRSVAYSPDGKWLAVGFGGSSETSMYSHKDGAFAILDAQTLELLHEGRDSKMSTLDVTFSPDLTLLALASADHCLYIYSALDNFSLRFKFSKASGRATRVDFAADSSMARISSDAFELLFVSTMDGSHITSPGSAADTMWASHKCLFAWDAQGVWDVVGRPDDRVRALAKANTQEMLVAATNQGELRVYNTPCISRHAEQHTLRGHSLDVANVVFTCDDSRLVSIGANDKSLLVWKVATR